MNGVAVTIDIRRLWQPRREDSQRRDDAILSRRLNPTGYPQVVEEVDRRRSHQAVHLRPAADQREPADREHLDPSFYGYDGCGTVRQLTNSPAQ